MMRLTPALLGPKLVPYHEWHLKEPLLINYEGWRILDNVKMTPLEAWTWDAGGTGRHLDPIIDDPRLTHRQRVCRLYRWALKELKAYIVKMNSAKFNIAYKVIRLRFEKYRYVTDPAMCDMMVRETQKYLRETCNPHFMRNDHRNPNAPQCSTNPMFHPDNCQVYDPWTPAEVFWYDDAKLHRYAAHHPMNSGTYENHERFGDVYEFAYGFQNIVLASAVVYYGYLVLCGAAFFHEDGADDPTFEETNKYYDVNLRQAIEAEERQRRNRNVTSLLGHNWSQILQTKTYQKEGYFKWWDEMAYRERWMDVSPVHGSPDHRPAHLQN
eukprot:CAMPEP_0174835108 /NCGR_PEP_ID=MMETSP1114-20130205/5240_1 /TAXON_ID=312471 /ORGANISM="Neobodo designis, Strain CCAP 1951/1" /LENGTH=324 /DNA_ID=CAMNT_0016069053 /DNA_START=172 /DNA_END=1146 /DNA_ORIENTATION=+